MSDHIERPGTIVQGWLIQCELCGRTHTVRFGYDEASIWLTRHLDDGHPGWADPLPTRPGFYLAPRADLDTVRTVVELLNSPHGQWVDAGDHTYLSEEQVRALGPLHRLVVAGQVKPADLDMVESDDFTTSLIEENRKLHDRINELEAHQ